MPKYQISKSFCGEVTERQFRSRSDAAATLAWKYAFEALDGLALRDRPIAYEVRDAINGYTGKNDRSVMIGDYSISIVRLS